ncbi:MAG: hypothetical protein HY317_04500 [Acidobacteria bacterium]|nr:hypothetical protein [Acidobacteriota bacterium]
MRSRLAHSGLLWCAVAFVAFLPFLRGTLAGQSFYFRDLSRSFIPLRGFAIEGLSRGELRYWNPFVHEGSPLPYPPVSYPPALLQLLLPGERGFSLILALHVPAAALAFAALARGLGLSPLAAAGGGLVYALGGFCLSSLNLVVHLEAMAWAPFVVLGLRRASEGEALRLLGGALAVGVALSTLGVEVVAQAVLVALVLSAGAGLRGTLRGLLAALLGTGLAAPTVFVMSAMASTAARGEGFHPSVVLAHSVHPFTFLQVVVAGLYGEVSDPVNRWWGQNFFPKGFPYFLSLYLGALVVALAWTGLRHGAAPARRRLGLCALVAGVLCLGRWAGIAPLVDTIDAVRAFRYPSKAFFTVHFAAALLAAMGLDLLVRGVPAAWARFQRAALALGGVLALLLPALPLVVPSPTATLAQHFFSPRVPWALRMQRLDLVVWDAVVGGLVALAAAGVAVGVIRGRMRAGVGTATLVMLAAADLLRAGAGLNPMVTTPFFRLSSEMAEVVQAVRGQGRIHTCEPEESAAYWKGRPFRSGQVDTWTFATIVETLGPYLNVSHRVPSALTQDLTALVPRASVPGIGQGCGAFDAIAERMRAAGVAWVLSVDPLEAPGLTPARVVAPARIAPLRIHLYRLDGAAPLRAVAMAVRSAPDAAAAERLAAGGLRAGGGIAVEGATESIDGASGRIAALHETSDRMEMTVEADRATYVVVRDTWAPGWLAEVDGAPSPLRRADGRHRAVAVHAGTSKVVLSYRPPGLRPGLAVCGLSAVILAAATALEGRRRRNRAEGS